ncbi:MAG: ZIP family metal transporter [Acutalibacteraceae bacterium]|nr:ZIP family metal transporter [Acutalibacteraceae bacterium]
MLVVLLTALGVGGATMVGALIGFLFKKIPHKFNDIVLGLAAGVMLAASVFGLIAPAMEKGGFINTVLVISGIFAGALFLSIMDKFIPHLHSVAGVGKVDSINTDKLNKVLLFVFAIAIHNFPEGIATGVSFGTGNISDALTVAGGIALQNIPEGMVIIAPMLSAGVSKTRTLIIALATGFVEVIGTFVGYFTIAISSVALPFFLAFAGGTMIYVISDEMIPETHSHGYEKGATYSLIAGFCIMLILDAIMG